MRNGQAVAERDNALSDLRHSVSIASVTELFGYGELIRVIGIGLAMGGLVSEWRRYRDGLGEQPIASRP